MPILYLIKTFGPYLAIVLIVTLIWYQGYNTANESYIRYIATQESETRKKLVDATLRIEELKKQSLEAARIIDEAYNTNKVNNLELATANDRILSLRLHKPSTCSSRSTVSGNTSSTEGTGRSTTSSIGILPEEALRNAGTVAIKAEEVLSYAIACKAYKDNLTNGNKK